ncbi:uncharacterized protein MAM_07680 [Metarhizium album ARSEF 1941]|uniref:Uncharacterized protein n=1 Tax=Metarhizium album (strain ARSEF 1941) TaxID=1081103 RepID=A0A0B2WLX7_METAS|nr:uncharacterized protein MAM_07680 [Metarhizium album ARSEF 1941]KHN94492.1 hypothetical protein MAM_07680 [Metarhizium album ARSEF 1941]
MRPTSTLGIYTSRFSETPGKIARQRKKEPSSATQDDIGKRRTGNPAMTALGSVAVPDEPCSHQHQTSAPATRDSSLDGTASESYISSRSEVSQSGCEESTVNGGSRRLVPASYASPTRGSGAGANSPRWYRAVRNWLSVSEPSACALKQQRVAAYQHHGIHLDDPDAAAKMHLPRGKVPDGVTTSTAGPDPEKALRERGMRDSPSPTRRYLRRGVSSGSTSSLGDASMIAPWVV